MSRSTRRDPSRRWGLERKSAAAPPMLQALKTPRPRFARLLALLLGGILLGGIGLACATAPPAGPPFTAAPAPGPGRARLYVYRVDPQASLSTVEFAIDGRSQGRLGNGEYATFEVAAGSHRLDLRLRGLAFASWGWNRQQVRAGSGETIYLEVSVRLHAQPNAQPAGQGAAPAIPGSGRDLEIAGRESGAASENVFLQHRSESDARAALAGTTRRVP